MVLPESHTGKPQSEIRACLQNPTTQTVKGSEGEVNMRNKAVNILAIKAVTKTESPQRQVTHFKCSLVDDYLQRDNEFV